MTEAEMFRAITGPLALDPDGDIIFVSSGPRSYTFYINTYRGEVKEVKSDKDVTKFMDGGKDAT